MKPKSPTPELFDDLNYYWSEIADAGSTEKQVTFVRRQVKLEGLTLDMACGNGRHSIPLANAGYDIVGLDISSNLLRIAKDNSSKAPLRWALVRADMRFLPFQGEVFSAVLSLDSSFGYLASEKEDLVCLDEVARVLNRSGIFLIDVFNRDRMIRKYKRKLLLAGFEFNFLKKFPRFASFSRWTDYPSFRLLSRRIIDEKNGMLRDLWIFRDRQTGTITAVTHAIRLYSFYLLRSLLNRAGFGDFRLLGGYEGQAYSEESGRLIVVSRKS